LSGHPCLPPARTPQGSSGGRAWWAHFEFTRINIEPIILPKKVEDVREAGATSLNAAAAFIASYRTTHFAQIVKAPIRWNGDPLMSRAGESAKVIVDVTAAAGQLRSLPAVLLRE
jgi:hypothetical protein